MKPYLFALLALSWHISSTTAQIPRVISFQGLLSDSEGQPLSGSYDLTFRIADEASHLVWTESHTGVGVEDGVFSVHLGQIVPLDLPFDQQYSLVTVLGGEEMRPPTLLVSVPYSLNSSALGGIGNQGYLKRNLGQTTTAVVDGAELLRVENTGTGRGMTVVSSGAHGIYGKTTSGQAAVEGEGAGTGPGVRGSSTALHGVIGYSGASGNAGVLGNSPGGYGVRGISTDMAGVHGYSDNSYGILGESANDNAVKGVTGATNEWIPAIYGRNQGAGDGVYGWSQARHGVFGVTYSVLGEHAGIYGVNNGGGPAIIADGRLIVRDAELRVEDDDGDLYVEGQYHGNIGQGGAPFPRPAFDSGWIEASEGAFFTLGVSQYLPASTYDRDHFVVDLMTKPGLWGGIGNWGLSIYDYHKDDYLSLYRGVYYLVEDDNDVEVYVGQDERFITHVRLRIWYYR